MEEFLNLIEQLVATTPQLSHDARNAWNAGKEKLAEEWKNIHTRIDTLEGKSTSTNQSGIQTTTQTSPVQGSLNLSQGM